MQKKLTKFLFLLLFFIIFSPNSVKATDYNFDFGFNFDSSGQFQGMEIKDEKELLGEGKTRAQVWNQLIVRYKVLIVGLSGAVTLTLIAFMMYYFTRLSAHSTNPQKRVEAIWGVAITFLAAAILGSGTILFGFAYNVFK